MLFAHASFVLEREITVTSHPNAPAIFTAICPSPPNPTTPTLDPRVALYRRIDRTRDSRTSRTANRASKARNRHREPFVDDVSRGVPTLVLVPDRMRPRASKLILRPVRSDHALGAHLFFAGCALGARETAVDDAPDADRVADGESRHLGSDRRARPGELVSRTRIPGFGITSAMCPAEFTTSL